METRGTAELRRLGETIREQRKQIGISQEDFAELCGVHRTYIGQIERGEKNISFNNILRVSEALKLSASELFQLAGL